MQPRCFRMKVFHPGAARMTCVGRVPRVGRVVGCRARCCRPHERWIQHCWKLVYPCQTFVEEIVGNAFE